MARGRKVKKGDTRSFGDFKKAQNEKRLDRIISQGKKSYASQDRGQSGGLSSIPSSGKKDAFVQLQRQKFFDNRPDVSEDRIFRRTRQEGGIDQFKQALIDKGRVLKDSKGNVVLNANTGEPVFLTDRPGGRSVSDVAQDLAFRFGPTPREVFGDIGYGLGSIAKGFAEKGTPMIQLLKGLYQKGKDYFTRPSGIETAVIPQASGGIYQGQPLETTPQFPYNFETVIKPRPEPLQPSEMSEEQFMESYPELYSQNPLFKQQEYKPFRVSDMDMSGVMASNIGQNILGNLQNLQNLAQQYNLDKIQFDPFDPNRIGYKDQFMINETPVNYQLYGTPQGGGFQLGISYKDGGSVDKYAGLGYKLK